jgi:electron transfer flavoprotein beta subunit
VKIAVCVKEVPDTSVEKRIDPSTMRLSRDAGDRTLNSFDLNAIEQAIRLKEAAGDGEVVLVSMGPARAVESIRKGLAMGADRAVLVADDAAAGSDLVATSYVLATALERENPDVILFGQQASDGDGAVMWSAVADRLTVAGGEATAKRQTEFGYDTIKTALPAVLAVSDAINEPRYPSLKGIMGAKKKPQDVLGLGDIGADASRAGTAGSKTEVKALNAPPSRGDTQKIEDDGSAAEKVVAFLIERKLV